MHGHLNIRTWDETIPKSKKWKDSSVHFLGSTWTRFSKNQGGGGELSVMLGLRIRAEQVLQGSVAPEPWACARNRHGRGKSKGGRKIRIPWVTKIMMLMCATAITSGHHGNSHFAGEELNLRLVSPKVTLIGRGMTQTSDDSGFACATGCSPRQWLEQPSMHSSLWKTGLRREGHFQLPREASGI